jgi:hypothetical protein
MPCHVREEDARGFALALGKMVLAGGVGGVLNIARLNIRTILSDPAGSVQMTSAPMRRPKAAIATP